jgi:tyrosine aminotransferase
MALRGLLNPGDNNILIPKPGFPMYQVACDAHKIQTKYYDLLPENNWEADIAQMESLIDENTKAILINNPSNPCGSVYSKQHLTDILALAEIYKLPIISDEIYGDMVFGDNVFYPLASISKTVPIISLGGLAKKFIIPGWRVGWVIVHDRNDILKEIREAYFKLSQMILGANSLVLVSYLLMVCACPGVGHTDAHRVCRVQFQSYWRQFQGVPRRLRWRHSRPRITRP